MSKLKKYQVIESIHQARLIGLFYHADESVAKKAVSACLAAGLNLIEFTNRGDGAIDVFCKLSQWAREDEPDLILGTGSVLDAGTASQYINAGSAFIVSPCFVPEVSLVCNRRGVAYLPGCQTLTELVRASEAGCDILKVFPASLAGGAEFIKAARAPMPWLQLMPTGGVNLDPKELAAWFEAGAVCVGLGSNLISSADLKDGNFKSIETKVTAAVAAINEVPR